jgi:hypothetical protein
VLNQGGASSTGPKHTRDGSVGEAPRGLAPSAPSVHDAHAHGQSVTPGTVADEAALRAALTEGVVPTYGMSGLPSRQAADGAYDDGSSSDPESPRMDFNQQVRLRRMCSPSTSLVMFWTNGTGVTLPLPFVEAATLRPCLCPTNVTPLEPFLIAPTGCMCCWNPS